MWAEAIAAVTALFWTAETGPAAPTPTAIASAPEAAARAMIAEGRPRLIYFITLGQTGIPGVTCSIPAHLWERVGFAYMISDVIGEPAAYDERDVARFNQAIVAAPSGPFALYCRVGGITLGGVLGEALVGRNSAGETAPIAPWSEIGAPARSRARRAGGDPLERDLFGMSPLARAAERGDHAEIRRIIARRPDIGAWCAEELERSTPLTDPLSIAVRRRDAAAARMIASRFAHRACDGETQTYHPIYQQALDAAVDYAAEGEPEILTALMPGLSANRASKLAEDLEQRQLFALALAADAAVPPGPGSILVQAADRCDLARFERAREPTLRRPGGRATFDAAWQVLASGSWPASGPVRNCLAMFERLVAMGHRLSPDSRFLYHSIIRDRESSEDKLGLEDARRLVAAFRAAGGDPAWNHNVPARAPCTAADAATDRPGSDCLHIPPGHPPTVFADILSGADPVLPAVRE